MFFFRVYKIGDWSLNNSSISRDFKVKTALQSENLKQIHNINTGKYLGWTYQHFRKQKESMLQV